MPGYPAFPRSGPLRSTQIYSHGQLRDLYARTHLPRRERQREASTIGQITWACWISLWAPLNGERSAQMTALASSR
jgi:hypothetical protein